MNTDKYSYKLWQQYCMHITGNILGKFSIKKFLSEAGCDKNLTHKIFLPQINSAVYNGL